MISGLPMVLSLDQVNLTDEQFYRLCQANRDIQLERSAAGALIIMSPVGGKSGNREADLITDLTLWNRKTALGKVFSFSTIFKLPNGGDRCTNRPLINPTQTLTLHDSPPSLSPPTTYYPPPTTYYLPPTTHYLPLGKYFTNTFMNSPGRICRRLLALGAGRKSVHSKTSAKRWWCRLWMMEFTAALEPMTRSLTGSRSGLG